MDSQPGPSRIKDDSPERPKKKYKTENDDDVGSQSSQSFSSTINDLPDEMLINIFRYLSIPDRLKAEKVCRRWSQFNNSELLWRDVNFFDHSAQSFFECDLKLFNLTLPLSLVELMANLHEPCPSLEAIILENIVFIRHCIANCSCDVQLSLGRTRKQKKRLVKMVESEFCKEDDELINTILAEMTILILRHVSFDTSNICIYIFSVGLPNLTMLDLSYSKPSLFVYTKDWLSNLTGLEELHLAGWKLTDCDIVAFIKNVRKLRVLDLGLSSVTDNTLAALHDNCAWLVELYLCGTKIRNVTCKEKAVFPCLQKFCVRKTDVTLESIEKLLNICPSLEYVNMSGCKRVTEDWYYALPVDFREKVDIDPINGDFCEFVKTRYTFLARRNFLSQIYVRLLKRLS